MSNPFQNFTRNLAGTSPQKLYNDLLKSDPVKGVTEFGKGLAQNLGSAYNVANTYTRGGLDQAMNNPILNPLSVPYNAINSMSGGALDKQFKPNKKEQINKNLRTEGDIRAFQKNINALPQTFSKNLENTIVNAPEVIGGLAGAALPGVKGAWQLGTGLVGAALPSGAAMFNKDIDRGLKGYKEFWQNDLNKTARDNQYAPEVLEAMSPESRAFLQSHGKTEVPKTSIRGEALEAMRFQAYKEHSERLKQLVKEGKISEEQAMKSLEDFRVGQNSQNFVADTTADALNFIPMGGGVSKAAKLGKVAQSLENPLFNALRHAEEGAQSHLPLGEISHQTKLPSDIQPQTRQSIDGSAQTSIFNLPPEQPNFYKSNSEGQLNLFGNQTVEAPKTNNRKPPIQQAPQAPEIPKVNSIGEYIGQEVVPAKQADLEANRANLSPSAISKRERTINKYIDESQSEPKTTDYRPLGTSFSPDTPEVVKSLDNIFNESGIVSPEQVIHVGDQQIPFQNKLQEVMINYGNFSRLKRALTPAEIAYKNQIDNILRNQLGMNEKQVAKFLEQSAYVRANTKKSIDQKYSTKYNGGMGSEGYFAQGFLPNKGNPVIQPMDMNSFNHGLDNTPSLGNQPFESQRTSYATGVSDSPTSFASKNSDSMLNNKTYGYHKASPELWDGSTDIGQQYNSTLSELNRPGDIPSYAKYQSNDAKAPEIVINQDLTGQNPMRDLQIQRHEDFHGLQHEKGQSLSEDLDTRLREDKSLSSEQRLKINDDYLNETNRLKQDLTGGDYKNNQDLENFIKQVEKETDYPEVQVLNELGAHMDQIAPHKEFMGAFKDAFNKAGKKLSNDNFKNNVIIELMDKKLVNDSKEAELVYDAFFKDVPGAKMLTEKILKEDIDFSRKGDHWINNLIGYTEDMRNGTYNKKNMPNLDYSNSPNVAGDLSRGQGVPKLSTENITLSDLDALMEMEKKQNAYIRERQLSDSRQIPEYSIPDKYKTDPELLRDMQMNGLNYDRLAKAQNSLIDSKKWIAEDMAAREKQKGQTAKDLGFFTNGY